MNISAVENKCERSLKRISALVVMIALGLTLVVGATPTLAQVHPHSTFMTNGSWNFENFGTSRMNFDTFVAAFDLRWYDYVNPITPIMYLAARDMAANGNCFGMVALAAEGEQSRSITTSFSGRLNQDFFSNYRTRNDRLDLDINTFQWRQLSSRFIRRWLVGIIDSAERNAERAARDIEDGKYGLLCINMAGRGHVLMPLSVNSTDENTDIVCYNPNLPLSVRHSHTVVINRASGNWRFHMDWSEAEGWHDTWRGGTTGISYVTYEGGSRWRDLLNNPMELVFGEGTAVKQITDGSGRKLYKNVPARGLADVDFSKGGLGNEVVLWVPITQRPAETRPKAGSVQPGAKVDRLHKAMTKRYGADYGSNSQIFFVLSSRLTLHIDIAARAQRNELKVAFGNPSGTTEVAFIPERANSKISPRVTIDVRDPAGSIELASRSTAQMKVSVTFANVDKANDQVTFEKTAALSVFGKSPTRVGRTIQGTFRIQAPNLKGRTEVTREIMRSDGRVQKFEPVSVQLTPQPEPPDSPRMGR